MGVGNLDVEAERLDAGEARRGNVNRPARVHAESAAKVPVRIVLDDQRLRGLNHVPSQRQPVEVTDHDRSAWTQHTSSLARSQRSIEPVPALPSAEDVNAGIRQSSRLGRRDPVVNADASRGIQLACLTEQIGRVVNPDDTTPPRREPASRGASPGPNIDNVLARSTNTHLAETIKQRRREARTMTGIVLSRPPEINAHAVTNRTDRPRPTATPPCQRCPRSARLRDSGRTPGCSVSRDATGPGQAGQARTSCENSVSEPSRLAADLGLGVPIIRVEMWEGRSLELKRRLARELTDTLVQIIDCDPATVRVLIDDYSSENWGVGGTLRADATDAESPDG